MDRPCQPEDRTHGLLVESMNGPRLIDKFGICQWFHYEAYADLERAVDLLKQLGLKRFRTGVSWADFHRPRGRQWYDWQMKALEQFDVLLSVWHTPPSISVASNTNSPPQRLEEYASFIGYLIQEYGGAFSSLELWNEPNNRLKWDFERYDPDWSKFGSMIAGAGTVARRLAKHTVLGGMIPVDHHWLGLMERYGVLDAVDAVAIHGFPDMWWSNHPNWDWYSHWHGWEQKISSVTEHAAGRPIWITETGLATWDLDAHVPARFDLQCRRLCEVARAPAERVYWYSLVDLDPTRPAIEGFHVDENEYHLGLVTYDGEKKPAWWTLKDLLENANDSPLSAAAS